MSRPGKDAGMCIFAIIIFLAILAGIGHKARAESMTRDDVKEILRLQYTEFCSVVKMPPAVLAGAINQAKGADPKTWLPVIEWWNAIMEKYREARCGDA